MRSLSLLGSAALLLLALAATGCSDKDNDNPGADCPHMAGRLCDGGREFIDEDAGTIVRRDGGGELLWGEGALLAISTSIPGQEKLVLYDIDADKRVTINYADINLGMGLAGVTQGLTWNAARTYLYIAQSGPNSVLFFSMGTKDIAWDYPFSDTTQLSRPILSADNKSLYLASSTDKALYKIDVPGRLLAQKVKDTDVPALSSPISVSYGAGSVLVGSALGNRLLAFNDSTTLSYDTAKSVDLVDGANQGAGPTSCIATKDAAFYCAASGAGAGIWYVKPGSPAKLVIPGVTSVSAMALSSLNEKLWVGTGSSLNAYWIARDPQAPLFLGSVAAGAPIFDIASSADGLWVFASVPTADALLKVRSTDLKLVKTFTDLGRPRALAVGPFPN